MPTALIVEDEPVANQLLSRLVQLRGYRTDSAYSGDEALRLAGRRPDVVFLDLMLPDIDGYAVCEALVASRETVDIPIVMVTARIAAENRVKGFRVGAFEYVPKPYLPDQIFAAMTGADAWRARIGDRPDRGRIVLRADRDVEHLRDVTELRGLLLDRTGLAEETVRRLGAGLSGLLQRGVDWGKPLGLGRVATLDYDLRPGGVELGLADESGWLRRELELDPSLAGIVDPALFAAIDVRDDGSIRFVLADS